LVWWFRYKEGVGGYSVIVIVDSETGAIIHEETGIALLRKH